MAQIYINSNEVGVTKCTRMTSIVICGTHLWCDKEKRQVIHGDIIFWCYIEMKWARVLKKKDWMRKFILVSPIASNCHLKASFKLHGCSKVTKHQTNYMQPKMLTRCQHFPISFEILHFLYKTNILISRKNGTHTRHGK